MVMAPDIIERLKAST